MAEDRPTPAEEAQGLYEEAETRTARAMEQLVSRDSFGELLARVTENTMALTRIGYDTMDLLVRNLRVAGRQDIIRLGRQLARTEDKLEMVLQEVERLGEEVSGQARARPRSGSSARSGASTKSGGSSSSKRSSRSDGGRARSR